MTPARDQIISAAYPLFLKHGACTVPLNELARSAGVTRQEFDQEFSSRAALLAECVARKEHDWAFTVVEASSLAGGVTPEEQLLGIFDVFSGWFNTTDFDACTFARVALEVAFGKSLNHAEREYQGNLLALVSGLAVEAHLKDQATFLLSWRLLIRGVIASLSHGDGDAPMLAKSMARDLISRHLGVAIPMTQVEQVMTLSAVSSMTDVLGAHFDADFDSLFETRLENDFDLNLFADLETHIKIVPPSIDDASAGQLPMNLSKSTPETDDYFLGYL